MKIGIGISTTPNRSNLMYGFTECTFPPESQLEVIIDTEYEGVAKTKNRLLEELEDNDHIFLFDDDCIPIGIGWWLPYIESGENHLMYQFKLPNKPSSDMRVLYQDDKIISYSHTRGAMIYITKKVLETVGGMDERYQFGYEHADWTNRIHNAGLTTHRAMDVVGSNKLFRCLDQYGKIESSVSDEVRRKNLIKNRGLYLKSKTSKEYMEYK